MSHTIGQDKEDAQESNSNSNHSPQESPNSEVSSSTPVSGLSDADYEFLFNQLLEGIAHGWHDRRIIKFFQQLGDRGKQSDWVAWLSRLQGKLLKLPVESKRQLGTLMIRLGELTQSATEVKQIGAASHSLGRELLFGNNSPAVIWEYVGADASPETQSMETEQELSARLPDDFVALADTAKEDEENAVAADLSAESENDSDDSSLNLGIEEIIDLLVPGEKDAVRESATSPTESKPESQSSETFSETLISADELWAEDLAVEPQVQSQESQPEIDLDLDLASNSTDEPADIRNDNIHNSYDDEFEFELEPQASTPEAAVETQGVAADLKPELPISAPERLEAIELPSEAREDNPKDAAKPKSIDLDLELEAKETAPEPNLELPLTASTMSLELEQLDRQNEPDFAAAANAQLDESTLELIESWFNLGLKQVSAGEYDKAIASWDKALTINANLPEAWHNRGSALGRLGNYEAAVKSFQNALEIDPDNYQAWNDRAHALYQLQEWSAAVESWTRAIEIMPGNHLFWYNRGCSLEQLSKWTEAISSYEKALEIKPDFQPGRSRYINLVADNSRPN